MTRHDPLLAALITLALGTGGASAQTILHVDDDAAPGGDGVSWATAFEDLQDALEAAALIADGGGSVEVWVAEGTYVPTAEHTPSNCLETAPPPLPDLRRATFLLHDDVALLGGFDGTEVVRSQRDHRSNQTILSGDRFGDDGPDFLNYDENVYHVVTSVGVAQSASLDGFIVTAGHVDWEIDTAEGTVLMFGCGAGIYNVLDADPTIANCTILRNYNSAVREYGPNGASNGGIGAGMFNFCQSDPLVVNCRFLGNVALNAGGAIFNVLQCGPVFVGCEFSGNQANIASVTVDQRCVFGDPACEGPDPLYINCTFHRNDHIGLLTPGQFVSPVLSAGFGATEYRNCIFWNNEVGTSGFLHDFVLPTRVAGLTHVPTFNECCLQAVLPSFPGTGNFSLDPRLLDPLGADGLAGTLDDDLRLLVGSPCIDRGTNAFVPADEADVDEDGDTLEPLPLDLGGLLRFIDDPLTMDGGAGDPPIVDLGADELGPTEPASPGPRLWGEPAGGLFGEGANWIPDAPSVDDDVVFDLAAIYTVTLDAPASNARLYLVDGDVTLDLQGLSYEATTTLGEAVRIGAFGNSSATLTIGNGTITAPSISVSGVGDGHLVLAADGAVIATSLETRNGGILSGTGTVTATVTNLGVLSPGFAEPGTLTVTGDLEQSGPLPNGAPALGTIVADVGAIDDCAVSDQLLVSGTAALSGTLVVRVREGCGDALGVGEQVTVLTAGARSGAFDVAVLPVLQDRFMRVTYGLGPGGGDVFIEVLALADFLDFDPAVDPTAATTPGEPTAAVTGDFDGDGDDDLAVTVAGAPGFVLVFVSGGGIGFTEVQQIEVGTDPSGITTGLFDSTGDGADRLDLAVTNREPGSADTISIILNTGAPAGSGEPLFAPAGTMSIGSPEDDDVPSAIAAANFDGADLGTPGEDDLAVVTAGTGSLIVLPGNGDGTFVFDPLQTIPAGPVLSTVDPADLDNPKDTDVDIIVSGLGDSSIRIFENLGGGSFSFSPIVIPVGAEPADVEIGDLDNQDGLDIVVASRGADAVSIILNQGGLTFTPSSPVPLGPRYVEPRSLTVQDLDLDPSADLDIAIVATDTESGDNVVVALRNDLDAGQLQFAGPDDLGADPGVILVLSGDVDGDADEDLVTVSSMSGASPMDGPADGPPPGATAAVGALLNQTHPFADLNLDGVVDFADMLLLLGAWGPCPGCVADLNGDDEVGFADLLLLLGAWTTVP